MLGSRNPSKILPPREPSEEKNQGPCSIFPSSGFSVEGLELVGTLGPSPVPCVHSEEQVLLPILHEGSLLAKPVLLHPPALTPPQGSGWRYWAVRVASPQLALLLCLSFFLPAISLCPRLCLSAWERIPRVCSTQVGVASGCPTLPVTQGGQVSNSSIKYQQVSLATDSWLSLSISFIGN